MRRLSARTISVVVAFNEISDVDMGGLRSRGMSLGWIDSENLKRVSRNECLCTQIVRYERAEPH